MSVSNSTADPTEVLDRIITIMGQMARVNDLWTDIAGGEEALLREGDEFQVEMLRVITQYMTRQLLDDKAA